MVGHRAVPAPVSSIGLSVAQSTLSVAFVASIASCHLNCGSLVRQSCYCFFSVSSSLHSFLPPPSHMARLALILVSCFLLFFLLSIWPILKSVSWRHPVQWNCCTDSLPTMELICQQKSSVASVFLRRIKLRCRKKKKL